MRWGIILIKIMMNKEKKKQYDKQYRLDNKERISEQQKQWRLDNKEYNKQWYQDNKERISEKKKQYRLDNKERVLEYAKQYRLDNKEKRKQYYLDNKERILEQKKEYNKQWYQDNKEKKNAYSKQYQKEQYNSDPLFKFKNNCRNRTFEAFKSKSWRKNGSTEKLLGCDYETAMNHIESQFEPWMNWDNHGEWEIDHIIPLASANTKEEMIPLFNYKNLQPLLAEDNRRKSAKIL